METVKKALAIIFVLPRKGRPGAAQSRGADERRPKVDSFFFVAKKLLSRFLFPVELVLILGYLGALACLWRKGGRLGLRLVFLSLVFLTLFSFSATSYLLLAPLENQAGPYARPEELALKGVRSIVVLSGGITGQGLTPADKLTTGSLKRLLEGVRLFKAMPGSKLVLSGGSFYEEISEAEAMADLAVSLGVPEKSIQLEKGSWDTDDQAAALNKRLAGQGFALVTSAIHMPRALKLFRAQGLNPIPAPADFRTRGFKLDYRCFFPSAGSLRGCEAAFYEYLGMVYTWVKTQ
jgi:uncharacterized SAM-binding protein YcdF (DUF218 family)